ncbi:MAG: hypothetical protein WAK17_21135 [Candidatus Nitrosopolaris sp.]
MVQKHIVISMITPVAIAGILIMVILANQAFAYYRSSSSSVKCKIYGGQTYCKSKHRHGNFGASNTGNLPQGASNTGNAAQESSNGNRATPQGASNTATTPQGASNTATIQMKCTTGYIWLPSGGFRHCSLGTVVNAPQGSSSTSGGVQKSSNTATTPQG